MIHTKPSADPGPADGRTIHLSLETPDPMGPSIRRLANSDAVLLTFPRDAFRRMAIRSEMSRRGVYLLISPGMSARHAISAYVGRTSNVRKRLVQHDRARRRAMVIQIAVLVSADDQLTDEQTSYVERRLIQLLAATDMVDVENAPANPAVPLRPDLRLGAERFLRDGLLLLGPVEPLLGMVAATAFSQQRTGDARDASGAHDSWSRRPAFGGVLLEFRRGPYRGLALRTVGRGMRILAGACMAPEIDRRLPARDVTTHSRLLSSGGLVPSGKDGPLMLMRDIDVASPTAAASLIAGRRVWGYQAWKPAQFDRPEGEL